jgi:hypothetical protein
MANKNKEAVGFAEGNGINGKQRRLIVIACPAVFVKGNDLFGRFIHDDKLDKVTYVPFYPCRVGPGHGPCGTVFTDYNVNGKRVCNRVARCRGNHGNRVKTSCQ